MINGGLKPTLRGNKMSDYRRYYVNGGTYFLTLALQNRQSDLLTSHIAELRQAYRETAAYYSFDTVAITVLPDHLHWLVKLPEKEHDFSKIVRLLKTRFTQKIPKSLRVAPGMSKDLKNEARIWQRRFWEHCIRSETDLKHHLFYTYFNPVKHGYVNSVKDWPYSSFHRDVDAGLFADDWGTGLPDEILNLYE